MEIQVKKKSILKLISSNYFFQVPRYQRGYAWEEENFNEYWSDFTKALENQTEHFLGVIIFYEKNKLKAWRQVEVIDGQQRLSTTIILLRCILEKLSDVGVSDEEIDKLYKKFFAPKNSRNEYKITLGEIDRDFFRNRILHAPKSVLNKKEVVIGSHKRILQADVFFTTKVKEFLSKTKKKKKALFDLLNDLEKFLSVVVINVPTDDEAFTIFETINSRGVELSVSDLLKNYIFSIIENTKINITAFNNVRSKWEKMEEQLQKKGIESSQFIRHYWLSKYSKIAEKDLYRAIKKKFKGKPQGVIHFAQSLFREAEYYINCLDSIEGKYISKSSARSLRDLNDLKIRQCYPLLLSLMAKNYPKKRTDVLLRKIVALNLRRGLMGINPNKLEIFYVEAALKVRRLKVKDSVNWTNKKINDHWVKDAEIKSFLIENDVSLSLARFVLRQLECSKHHYKEDKVPKKPTIEHILPQNPKLGEWDLDQETLDLWVNNIGNLTLVGREINSEMKNSKFAIKRRALKQTQYAISLEIRKNRTWGPRQIGQRARKIAEFICREWNL